MRTLDEDQEEGEKNEEKVADPIWKYYEINATLISGVSF